MAKWLLATWRLRDEHGEDQHNGEHSGIDQPSEKRGFSEVLDKFIGTVFHLLLTPCVLGESITEVQPNSTHSALGGHVLLCDEHGDEHGDERSDEHGGEHSDLMTW